MKEFDSDDSGKVEFKEIEQGTFLGYAKDGRELWSKNMSSDLVKIIKESF